MAGVEAYLEGLAAILQPNAELYGICVLKELAERLEHVGVRVTRLPVFARARILRFLTAWIVLTYLVVRHRIDVVQINGFLEAVLLIPARILGCETVYTRHGPFEMEFFKWYEQPAKFMPRFLARHCASFASRLVCVSETVGGTVKSTFPEARVSVIPNWVSRLPEYRARENGTAHLARIVYVGRLEKYKGLQLLLDAMRGLPATLTVVGEGGYRQELERLAAGMDVSFVGFQSDPRPYYEKADVFVMPSMGPEGLPMVALEAMSHSLPCVFSDLPVHCEITDEGRAALLFRSGDTQDLRQKLMAFIENRALRRQYSESAYRMVRTKYHVDSARQAYLQVFEVGI